MITTDFTRVDQNTGGALLEFPMRTAMHGKFRVSSAISVCDYQKNFNKGFTPVAEAQRVFGVVVTGWCTLEVRARVETLTKFCFSNDFYFNFVRPNGLE